MVDIKEVAENILLIDDELYSIPKWGSVYLINEEKKALVDTGPSTSVSAVLGGLEKAGIDPGEIKYIIITHIHLDHAGGAGELIRHMPGASVIVHEKGARHLVNPDRLMESFASTMGERMMKKTGPVTPIDEKRVESLRGGEVLELGKGQSLRFFHVPGHAPHQLCVLESRNNGLFSGDAIGISVAEGKVVLPAAAPPSFDLELTLNSLQKLLELKASLIYFAHFGAAEKVSDNIRTIMDKLRSWNEIISRAYEERGYEAAFTSIRNQLYRELEPARDSETLYQYLADGIVAMNVTGLLKYFQDRRNAQ